MSYCQGIGCFRQLTYHQVLKGYRYCGPCNRELKGYSSFSYTPTFVSRTSTYDHEQSMAQLDAFSLEYENERLLRAMMERMKATCGDNHVKYVAMLKGMRDALREHVKL